MKKILLMLALFLAEPVYGMDENDKALHACIRCYQIYLYEYNKTTREKHPWPELKSALEKLENVSAQNITNAIFVSLGLNNCEELAHNLLLFWAEKIDFQVPCLDVFANFPFDDLLFNSIIGEYVLNIYRLSCGRKVIREIAPLQRLYVTIVEKFSEKININHRSHSGKASLDVILSQAGSIARRNYDIECILIDILKRFEHTISYETYDSAYERLTPKETDSEQTIFNKKYFLEMLNSYYPKKLRFTNERLKTLHNCHFNYVYCPQGDSIWGTN